MQTSELCACAAFVLLHVDLISGLLQTHGGDSREITDQF